MLDAAVEGFLPLLDLTVIAYLLIGVLIGQFFAAVPGVGAVVPLSMLLPFAITLPPATAVTFLIGIVYASNTANTFPSVLIAVPGSSGSQATIVDGYPMAQNGEAARAFGAAFIASGAGGLFGAVALFAAIPIMTPLVLSLGSPELFVLIFWGLTMVGVLSTGAPIKGLIAACIGLLISTIGDDLKSGVARFVFEEPYLWEGIKFSLVGLGFFAVPEIIFIAARRGSIAAEDKAVSMGTGMMQGVRDCAKSWFLILRCSALGTWIGFVPGIGGSVVDWISYAHAKQTEKNTENFGKGDVRGVIAPESSNSSKDGGALIPTLAFGIPGSTGYALFMAALIAVGISPGPDLMTDRLDVIFLIIYGGVIGAIVASALCMGLAAQVAKVAYLPYTIIVPLVLGISTVAAFAATFQLADLLVLLVASILGTLMKHFDWPRPPMVLGVVLGAQAETFLWLSTERYGLEWLLRPGVILIGLLIVTTLFYPYIDKRRRRRAPQ